MLAGRSFVVEQDIYLQNPANRAFVMGERERPAAMLLWIVPLIDLPITVILIGLGTGLLPIPLPEEFENMRWLMVVMGFISLAGTVFVTLMIRRMQRGDLLEGRVIYVEEGVVNRQKTFQRIVIRFKTPEGEELQTVIYRTGGMRRAMPKVGQQAAILYGSRNQYRAL